MKSRCEIRENIAGSKISNYFYKDFRTVEITVIVYLQFIAL